MLYTYNLACIQNPTHLTSYCFSSMFMGRGFLAALWLLCWMVVSIEALRGKTMTTEVVQGGDAMDEETARLMEEAFRYIHRKRRELRTGVNPNRNSFWDVLRGFDNEAVSNDETDAEAAAICQEFFPCEPPTVIPVAKMHSSSVMCNNDGDGCEGDDACRIFHSGDAILTFCDVDCNIELPCLCPPAPPGVGNLDDTTNARNDEETVVANPLDGDNTDAVVEEEGGGDFMTVDSTITIATSPPGQEELACVDYDSIPQDVKDNPASICTQNADCLSHGWGTACRYFQDDLNILQCDPENTFTAFRAVCDQS